VGVPLRILHLAAPAPFGGLEGVVRALAGGMARRDHQIRVAVLLPPDEHGHGLEGLLQEDVALVEIRTHRRGYLKQIDGVARELGRVPGTVLHCHGYHADVVGLRAARPRKSPTISTVHGYVGGSLRNRCYEWLDRRVLREFNRVIAVSRPLGDQLLASGIPNPKLLVIPNAYAPVGIPLSKAEARRELGLPTGGLVAGWVGRLAGEKGPDVFLEALAAAPAWQASFIGSGPELSGLEARTRELGLENRVRFHSALPNAGSLLQAFDVVVISSRTEGTPLVLFEAMAAEVPVITSRVGGIPDVVGPDQALIIAPDSPQELVGALQAVEAQPGAASGRAANARRVLETRFAAGPWLDRYEAVYAELMGRS